MATSTVLTFQLGRSRDLDGDLISGMRMPTTDAAYFTKRARRLFHALGISPADENRARLYICPDGTQIAYDIGSGLTEIPGPRERITVCAPVVAVEFA